MWSIKVLDLDVIWVGWGSVEALPTPSERCEAAAAPSYERQVVRAIPQCTAHGHGTPLLSQLLQQEPGPPGPHPPSSSSSDSDEGGPPGTGLWYEGEWWWYDDVDGNGGDGAAGGAVGGGVTGSVHEEGMHIAFLFGHGTPLLSLRLSL